MNCSDGPPSTVSIGIAIVHAVWIERVEENTLHVRKTVCLCKDYETIKKLKTIYISTEVHAVCNQPNKCIYLILQSRTQTWFGLKTGTSVAEGELCQYV